MIRGVYPSELPELVEGGKEFFAEADIPGGFEPEYFVRRWTGLIGDGTARVLGAYGEDGKIRGALGWLLHPGLYNSILVATEGFWFTLRRYRGSSDSIRLLDRFEKDARAAGAKRFAMIHLMTLNPEQLDAFYQRRGYKLIEKHYEKEA